MNWTDLRFLFNRITGLSRRGLASLRTRGFSSTWRRVKNQFLRVPQEHRAGLYFPDSGPFATLAVPAPSSGSAPMASLVIPVFNHFGHTLACLRALAAHPPLASIEIICVDDGSSDETATALPQVAGLRYHRRPENGGFIAACNDGLALARGEYVIFLNNDTVPQPGWLDVLLSTFAAHPGTGIVGAALLYPDGRLQEAGGVVWRDGSADKLGRLQAADSSAFAHVRRVDYVSGAALAIPRALCLSLGGFDSLYAPAFYEDTDLAMRVRATGLQVLVQPASHVVHVEGVTTGTDDRHGVKSGQPINQRRFAERWKSVLPAQPPHATKSVSVTDHHYRQTVLVVDALTPRPDRDSGSLRMVNLMRLLHDEGAHVVFLPANHARDGQYTEALGQLGVETWFEPWSGSTPGWLREHGDRFDAVVLSRHYVARDFLPLIRKHARRARVVFDSVDLHYLRERRGAEVSGNARAQRAAEQTRALELDVIRRSDVTLVVSEVEKRLLAIDAPDATVEVLSNLHQIAGPGLRFEERDDLVFVGGFRHPPNVDAVHWFASSVFPHIRERLPGVRFHCIGDDVPDEIAALASQPGVIVHGHVPDIAPYMDGARIAVAPLRFGAGVKGKVNLSMAHGQPVVATSCAVEGMHLRAGEDVLVADDAMAFAEAVVQAYLDETLWQRLAENGLLNVERHFSLEAGRDVVRRVLLA
ncbi:glycosyltransferase [Lysobacter sp. Root494]|uniref:glycosyltransferase n=1 Tax=Lysobacter sp. Root494 TaxID=1736549 RepID=UPI000701792E|nr:glycosyltransferase [Lysobacter sp. Root494]KQY49668.1 glycosyl transferase [Lysobacter sp. Root494]